MGISLDKLTIKGFKSIRKLVDFELKNLNVIVGGNGLGKSNLIGYFKMLSAFMGGKLNRYARDNGGVGDLLFKGRKITEKMEFVNMFGMPGFRFKILPTINGACAIEGEAFYLSCVGGKTTMVGVS